MVQGGAAGDLQGRQGTGKLSCFIYRTAVLVGMRRPDYVALSC
jgi:hypothetical protein